MRPPSKYLQVRYAAERIAVCLALPFLVVPGLFVALAIMLDSRGPIFFRQLRPGRGTSYFTIYKFRTMFQGSLAGPTEVTAINDHRVTSLGRILRATHIDELPQLWNVLKGEMSLIGPRPEPITNTALFEKHVPGYHARRCVQPGITGWAQVEQGYTDSIPEAFTKLNLDLYYVHNATLLLDATILARTIKEVFKRERSR